METSKCPKCGSDQRTDLDPHWWICGSCMQGNGEFVQTKICEHGARLKSEKAAAERERERLREKLQELAATARSPCQVSGAWAADQIDSILAGES